MTYINDKSHESVQVERLLHQLKEKGDWQRLGQERTGAFNERFHLIQDGCRALCRY